jgi:hypothetical protein
MGGVYDSAYPSRDQPFSRHSIEIFMVDDSDLTSL